VRLGVEVAQMRRPQSCTHTSGKLWRFGGREELRRWAGARERVWRAALVRGQQVLTR